MPFSSQRITSGGKLHKYDWQETEEGDGSLPPIPIQNNPYFDSMNTLNQGDIIVIIASVEIAICICSLEMPQKVITEFVRVNRPDVLSLQAGGGKA